MNSSERIAQVIGHHDKMSLRDGQEKHNIPLVLFGNTANPILVPPSIVDLLRDKPTDSELTYLQEADGFEAISGESSESSCLGNGKENDGSESEEWDEISFDGVHVEGEPSWMTHPHKHHHTNNKTRIVANDWKCIWWQYKSVGGKLVPFLKTLGLYFMIFIPEDDPSFVAMALKCLPVLSLALFVTLNGISFKKQHRFARQILGGLLSSCLGDALLIWPSYFLHGMAAFALAQCFYIRAFGFRPLNLKLGAVIFALSSTSLFVIGPGIVSGPKSLTFGVIIYSCLLGMMTWRALAPLQIQKELLNCTNLCSSLGAISFVISDIVLALNKFYTQIPHYQVIIMSTYYTAQLGLALSVVNANHENEQKDEKSQSSNQSALIKRVI